MLPLDQDVPRGGMMANQRVIDLNQAKTQDDGRAPAPLRHGEAVEAFRDALAAAGLGRPDIEADGRIHRFALSGERANKKSGWYVFYPDNIPAGSFGSWKHDLAQDWSSRAQYELTRAEVEEVRRRFAQAQAQRDAERAQLAREAAERAATIWADSQPATAEHPYLANKRVGAFDVRLGNRGNELLVPMYDAHAALIGLQRIAPDGTKRFLFGTAKAGAFHLIDGDRSTLYICEGYATGASVHMATGAAVGVAFDAGNLAAVCQALRQAFPQARMIVCADNDRWTRKPDGTPWNTGVEDATRAAKAVGAEVIVPEFRDLSGLPTDFNDLHVMEGLEAVEAQVRGYSVRIADWSLAGLNGRKAPERQWLVEQTIPLGAAIVLAAAGGTGKGLLTLDLALKVAGQPSTGIDFSGNHVFGHLVLEHGPVVIFAAEDDLDELHRRGESLGGNYPARLYAVAMPDLSEPRPIVVSGPRGPEVTDFWREISRQIKNIRPKLVIFDPLSCFVRADSNDPTVGAYSMGLLASLARQSGAAIVVVHHFNKIKEGIDSPEAARTAIRGSTALVDHARGAYALWGVRAEDGKRICKQVGLDYQRGRVVRGCLVKANFPADNGIKTFVRQVNGLLTVVDDQIRVAVQSSTPQTLDAIVECIRDWAVREQPFAKTGKPNGIAHRREDLPQSLRDLGRNRLEDMVQQLLDQGRIVTCVAQGGSSKNRLDVPGGPVASGMVKIAPGHQGAAS